MLTTILALICCIAFSYAGWIVISAYLANKKRMSISEELNIALLGDLAPIWLKYNNEEEEAATESIESLYGVGNNDSVNPPPEELPPPVQQEKEEETAVKNKVEEPAPEKAPEPPPPDKPADPKKNEQQGIKVVQSDELNDLIRDCIDPYANTIRMQQVEHVIKGLIDLLDKYGGAPSVVMGAGRDIEKDDLTSVKDNLAKISLRYHTCGVVRNMVASVKDTYNNAEMVMPKAIVEALAHDIGKIPEFRDSNIYNTSEHPLISGDKLAELFGESDVHWKDDAIKAVKEHHLSVSGKTIDQMLSILKQSDRKARANELIMFTKGYQIIPFEKWFDPAAFIEKLKPSINISRDDMNRTNAISFKGVIYIRPNFLYDIARQMCVDARALDANFFYKSDSDNAKLMVAKALRDAGYVTGEAAENSKSELNGRYSYRYEIRRNTGDKPMKEQFLPITMDEKFDIKEIEGRKISGYLLSIVDIYRK